ncbi:glutathione S-transferase [Boletus coccyginus]|nr:glutathione S-transferase [Boletus coccyginus]
MVLKIYGYARSTYTRLVALICKEKGIPYELVIVDLGKRTPSSSKNSHSARDDHGFILFESRAIARYLIKKYPNQGTTGLIPTDPKGEALFEQAASVEASNFDAYATPLAYEKMFKTRAGGQTDQARVDEYQKYLAGDNATLADLQHLPYGSLLLSTGYGDVIKNRPNVARPAWQAIKDVT